MQLLEIKERLDGQREVRSKETIYNLEDQDYVIDSQSEEEEDFEPTGDKMLDEKKKKEIEDKRQRKYQRLVKKIEKGREEADKIFQDFERNLGYRLQKMSLKEEEEDEDFNEVDDAESFYKEVTDTYDILKKDFRSVMYKMRDKNLLEFRQLGKDNADKNSQAYNEMKNELQNLKAQMIKTKEAQI